MMNKRFKFALLGVAALALISGGVFAGDDHGHGHEEAGEHGHDGDEDHAEGVIRLTPAQIDAAGITVAPVSAETITGSMTVPGRIVPDETRMAQVTPKIAGTVTSVKKNLGDSVEKGETLAEIESREMADAAAEYRAAVQSEEITRTILNRERTLWERKITAQQDYLDARNAHQEASIRTELARQKLRTLGHDDASLKRGVSRFHILNAPIAGRIIEREITPGAFADTGTPAFTVADLSVVWANIALPPDAMGTVREGQSARITGGAGETGGTVIFISPAVDTDTGAAKAIIEIPNPDGLWRPGLFISASIVAGDEKTDAGLSVPKSAIQTVEGKPSLFVRTDEGFEIRPVTTGRDDGTRVEIISGVKQGEPVAVTNSFTLKAELGKAEAEHSH